MVTGVADRADNDFDGDDRDEQVKYEDWCRSVLLWYLKYSYRIITEFGPLPVHGPACGGKEKKWRALCRSRLQSQEYDPGDAGGHDDHDADADADADTDDDHDSWVCVRFPSSRAARGFPA